MWKCKRCGDCCKYLAETDEWENGVNSEQKEKMKAIVERTERGCEALVKVNGEYTCLSQYLFNVKPEYCRTFGEHKCAMTTKVKEVVDKRDDIYTSSRQ